MTELENYHHLVYAFEVLQQFYGLRVVNCNHLRHPGWLILGYY